MGQKGKRNRVVGTKVGEQLGTTVGIPSTKGLGFGV